MNKTAPAVDKPPAHRTRPVDSPSRGPWLDHRSPADAYGLTRFACQTAIEKEVKEKPDKTL